MKQLGSNTGKWTSGTENVTKRERFLLECSIHLEKTGRSGLVDLKHISMRIRWLKDCVQSLPNCYSEHFVNIVRFVRKVAREIYSFFNCNNTKRDGYALLGIRIYSLFKQKHYDDMKEVLP